MAHLAFKSESSSSSVSVIQGKDSLEHAIEELEKTLENSKDDNEDDDDGFSKIINPDKRIRHQSTSDSSERSFIVLDELSQSDNNHVTEDENSRGSSCVIIEDELQHHDNELMNNVNSFSCGSDNIGDITVVHNTVQKINEEVSVTVLERSRSNANEVSLISSTEKNDSILSDVKPDNCYCDKTCVIGTPTLVSNCSNVHEHLKSKKTLVTSTPYRQNYNSCENNINNDTNNSSVYMPPARSILEKWKPSCLQLNTDQGLEDISAIECNANETLNKTTASGSLVQCSHLSDKTIKVNEFEEAFSNLYLTLFGDEAEVKSTSLSSNVKLKLYHDNIVKQHKQDNIKFNEIISEISSNSNKSFIANIVGSNKDEIKNDLSLILEECEGSSCDKTVIENFNNKDNNIAKIVDKSLVNFSKNDKNLSGEEVLEVPVINGANSIVYLNNREFTLDEDDMLLDDDIDAISLACSDIDSVTPRPSSSEASSNKSTATESLASRHRSIDSKSSDNQIAAVAKKSESVKPTAVPPVIKKVDLDAAAIPISPVTIKPDASNVTKPTSAPKSEPNSVVVPVVTVKSNKLQDVAPSSSKSDPSQVVSDRNAVFISDNPQENEDNNHPGWEHLRRLRNDKERYKALRERWHSVVIPDPNLDLTSQMYRMLRMDKIKRRNQTTVLSNFNGRNGGQSSQRINDRSSASRTNFRSHGSCQEPPNKRRKLCTLLFEKNTESLLRKLEYKRYCIHQEMDVELLALALQQETEYQNAFRVNSYDPIMLEWVLRNLHGRQTREVFVLREAYESKIKAAEAETQEYISALNAATDEVLTFHKFYQDLDSANNNSSNSMYFSDAQFNELVETEHMLELYRKFYNN